MQQLVLLNSSHPGLVLFCKFGAEVDRHLEDEHLPRGLPRARAWTVSPQTQMMHFWQPAPKNENNINPGDTCWSLLSEVMGGGCLVAFLGSSGGSKMLCIDLSVPSSLA